jgi:DNA replication protein DnaC
MRTQEQWEKHNLKRVMEKFSPRLQRDLQTLKNIPTFKEDPKKPGSFYIWGPTGSGKTTIAGNMFLTIQQKYYFERLPGSCVWTTCYDFFSELKSAFDNPVRSESAVMGHYASAAQLYLDDLGDVKFTDWNISQLQVLINQRYEMLLPMVITSNLSLAELEAATGDARIPSRISRMCKVLEVGND